MFTLSVATATVSVDTIIFVHIFATFIFSVCTLSGASVTVSVETMEFGQPNKTIILTCLHSALLLQLLVTTPYLLYCFVYIVTTIIDSKFTLSVATATVIVDTVEFGQPNINHHFNMFALSLFTAAVSGDTIIFCVYIYNNECQCVYT